MATANARVLRTGDAGTAPLASPGVEALRAESRAALTRLVTLLRYPPEWAHELEQQAFAAGRVWSSADAEGAAAEDLR